MKECRKNFLMEKVFAFYVSFLIVSMKCTCNIWSPIFLLSTNHSFVVEHLNNRGYSVQNGSKHCWSHDLEQGGHAYNLALCLNNT